MTVQYLCLLLLLILFYVEASELKSVGISLDNNKTGAVSTASVIFTVVNEVPSGGKIHIIFPSGFTLPSTINNPTISASSGLTGNVITASKSGTRTIVVSLGAGTSLSDNAVDVTIGIPECVNPRISQTTGTFQIETRDSTSPGALSRKRTRCKMTPRFQTASGCRSVA